MAMGNVPGREQPSPLQSGWSSSAFAQECLSTELFLLPSPMNQPEKKIYIYFQEPLAVESLVYQ